MASLQRRGSHGGRGGGGGNGSPQQRHHLVERLKTLVHWVLSPGGLLGLLNPKSQISMSETGLVVNPDVQHCNCARYQGTQNTTLTKQVSNPVMPTRAYKKLLENWLEVYFMNASITPTK